MTIPIFDLYSGMKGMKAFVKYSPNFGKQWRNQIVTVYNEYDTEYGKLYRVRFDGVHSVDYFEVFYEKQLDFGIQKAIGYLDTWIVVEDGDIFEGTRSQFVDCFFSNADDVEIINWCAENGWKLKIGENFYEKEV